MAKKAKAEPKRKLVSLSEGERKRSPTSPEYICQYYGHYGRGGL